MVVGVGFEPTAFGGGYEPNKKRSYRTALPHDMVVGVGFEPTTFWL